MFGGIIWDGLRYLHVISNKILKLGYFLVLLRESFGTHSESVSGKMPVFGAFSIRGTFWDALFPK